MKQPTKQMVVHTMAFDIQKNKRLVTDDINEVDLDDNNETTMNLVK